MKPLITSEQISLIVLVFPLLTLKYRLGNNPSRQCNQLKAQIYIPNAFKLQDKKRYVLDNDISQRDSNSVIVNV